MSTKRHLDDAKGHIGVRLREERERLRYNQSDFAAAAGVSKTTQVHYESGRRTPGADYIQKITNKLGVDFYYVMQGTRPGSVYVEAVDRQLLVQILDVIEAWAGQRKRQTPSRLKAELTALFYEQFRSVRQINEEIIAGHLKLLG